MALPVLIGSDSVSGQTSFLKDIRPGKYTAFYVKFSGDAAAAQTFAVADLGRCELLQAGRPLVSVDADNMISIGQLLGGNLRTVAAAAGVSQQPLVIPRYWGDDNIHQVNVGDQLQVKFTFGANFTTKFTGADLAVMKVYGLVRETGQMAYNLLIQQIDKVYGPGTFREPLQTENVLAIYIVVPGTATDLDRVRVEKDGYEVCNVATSGPAVNAENDLQEISDWERGQEAATDAVATTANSPVAEITVAYPGQIGEFLSDNVSIEFTTSPAATYTQEMVVFSADFTDVKLRQTKAEDAAIVQRKISRKVQFGRRRPVTVLEELTGG